MKCIWEIPVTWPQSSATRPAGQMPRPMCATPDPRIGCQARPFVRGLQSTRLFLKEVYDVE